MEGRADKRPPRELVERLALAALGAFVLTADRIESLVDDLTERGGMTRDEARSIVEDSVARWRGETARATERAGEGLRGLYAQLGLVTREEYEDLELRVAQLEHRLRLVEQAPPRV